MLQGALGWKRGEEWCGGGTRLLPCPSWEPPTTAPCLGPPGPFQGTRAVRGRPLAPGSWPKRISGAEGTLPAPCCPLAMGLPRRNWWEQALGGAGSTVSREGSGPTCPPVAHSHPVSSEQGRQLEVRARPFLTEPGVFSSSPGSRCSREQLSPVPVTGAPLGLVFSLNQASWW